MAVDVSKFLHFVNPRVISPLALFDRNAISNYLTQLEADGIGPSARKTKLTHLSTAMNFAVLQAGVTHNLQAKAHFASEAIGQLARALGQVVRKKQIMHMEELAEVIVYFKGCKAFIEDQWFYKNTVRYRAGSNQGLIFGIWRYGWQPTSFIPTIRGPG